jgi:DNA mismatch repair protein MSH5
MLPVLLLRLPFYFLWPCTTDGAGLFCGVLRHLLHRGSACPKVLVATHFHDVFRHDILDPESVPITFLHMQVMFTSEGGEVISDPVMGREDEGYHRKVGPGEKITYLYR